MTAAKAKIDVSLDQMKAAWTGIYTKNTYLSKDFFGGFAVSRPKMLFDKLQPGINRPLDYYFNTGYAIPAYECWLNYIAPIPPFVLPICKTRTEVGSSSSLTPGPQYDIFPNTLDDFMASEPTGNDGYRLKWDARFPTSHDQDGDGLVTGALLGSDPNDQTWDSDADGLADRFELEKRTDGVSLSSGKWDTDGDGLSDAQELQFGSDPGRQDTDNDGLLDGQEVYHQQYDNTGHLTTTWGGGWAFCVAPWAPGVPPVPPACPGGQNVTISSDPSKADTDGDGISDLAEKQLYATGRRDRNALPYNPQVFNTSPLRVYMTASSANGFVGPDSTLLLTSTVLAETAFAPGALEITVPPALGGTPLTYRLDLPEAVTLTLVSGLTVDPTATSQDLVLGGVARARLPSIIAAGWTFSVTENTAPSAGVLPPLRGRAVDVTSAWPDRPDRYLRSTLISEAAGQGSHGDIRAYAVSPAALSGSVGDTANPEGFLQGEAAPGTACNGDGRCMIVWDQMQNCNTVTVNQLKVLGFNASLDAGGGLEPLVVFLEDQKHDRTDWTVQGGQTRLLWACPSGGQCNMTVGQSAPPNQPGLPKSQYFCNDARFQMWEQDTGTLSCQNGFCTGWETAERVGQFVDGRVKPQPALPVLGTYPTFQFESSTTDPSMKISLAASLADQQTNVVFGAVVDPDLTPATHPLVPLFSLSPTPSGVKAQTADLYPAVASDGSNGFLVVWNRKTASVDNTGFWVGKTQVLARRFDASGHPFDLDATVLDEVSYRLAASATIPYATSAYYDYNEIYAEPSIDAVPSVMWAGDRYRVLWAIRAAPGDAVLRLRTANVSQAGVVGTKFEVTADLAPGTFDRHYRPQQALDPIHGVLVVPYRSNSAGRFVGVGYDSPDSTQGAVIDDLTYTGANQPLHVSIAYNPANQGYMLSYQFADGTGSYLALNFDGSLLARGSDPISWLKAGIRDSARPLVCPAPSSAPVAALPLDELPGSGFFRDISGNGNDGACFAATCPLVGVAGVGTAGQTNAPGADRALAFDGSDDKVRLPRAIGDNDFSIAFWLKTDQVGPADDWYGGAIGLVDADSAGRSDVFGVALGIDKVMFNAGGTTITGGAGIADGRWHQVVATRRGKERTSPNGGEIKLYVDGAQVASGAGSSGPLSAAGEIILGSRQDCCGFFRGNMSFLMLYDSVLGAQTVLDLYGRHLPSAVGYGYNPPACLLTGSRDNGFPEAEIRLVAPETRGGLIESRASLTLTLDATAPTTTIDLLDNQYVKVPAAGQPNAGQATLIISGASEDTGSGVSIVAVQASGQSDSRALGTDTWTYALAIREGATTVQARAADGVGNIEGPNRIVTVIGDGTPPQLGLNLPAGTIIPVRTGTGAWAVALGGSLSDPPAGDRPGSGIDLATAKVQLQAADGSPLGWQPVPAGPWQLDYLIPASIGDPTGNYTVTLHVADRVGHEAETTGVVHLVTPSVRASLSGEEPHIINGPLTLTGAITGTTGLTGLQAAFTPIDQLVVISHTVMYLPLDEPAGAVWFDDAITGENSAYCTGPCPVAGQPGRVDSAVRFNRDELLVVDASPSLDAIGAGSFSIQAWIKPEGPNSRIVSKFDGTNGYVFWVNDLGYLELLLVDKNGASNSFSGFTSLVSGDWAHVAAVVDAEQGKAQLYVNGARVSGLDITGDFSNHAGLEVGGFFAGLLDEVLVTRRALTASGGHVVLSGRLAAPPGGGPDPHRWRHRQMATGSPHRPGERPRGLPSARLLRRGPLRQPQARQRRLAGGDRHRGAAGHHHGQRDGQHLHRPGVRYASLRYRLHHRRRGPAPGPGSLCEPVQGPQPGGAGVLRPGLAR